MSKKWSTGHHVVNTFVRNNNYMIYSDYTPITQWLYDYSTIYSWQHIFINESFQEFDIYCVRYISIDIIFEHNVQYNGP